MRYAHHVQSYFRVITSRFVLLFVLLVSFVSSLKAQTLGTQPQLNKELTVNLGGGIRMEFVLIPNGSFAMGSDKIGGNENPLHNVTISKSFYFGKYLVTQDQWHQIMGRNPSCFKGAKNPVEQVSWNDCQNFITKLKEKVPGYTFRLPTETEWEYACRAGSTSDYCYGDDVGRLREYAWYISNAGFMPHPVGEKKPNAWGLFDMHGNVWEWCQDVYHKTYVNAPADGSAWTQGGEPEHVLRGGSWGDSAPPLRSASRISNHPSGQQDVFGLRVVVEVWTP